MSANSVAISLLSAANLARLWNGWSKTPSFAGSGVGVADA
jgi:hypothetical protein